MRKAYRIISKQLDGKEPNKAIDDLVKLLKADKDLGTDEVGTGEIGLRWEKSKHEE